MSEKKSSESVLTGDAAVDSQAVSKRQTNRRRALKGITIGGGVFTLTQWSTPVVQSVILPAHAGISAPEKPDPTCFSNSRTDAVTASISFDDPGNTVMVFDSNNSQVNGNVSLNISVPFTTGNFSVQRVVGGCEGDGAYTFSGTVNGGDPGDATIDMNLSGCVDACFDSNGDIDQDNIFTCCLEGSGTLTKTAGGGGFAGQYSGSISVTQTCGETGDRCLPG